MKSLEDIIPASLASYSKQHPSENTLYTQAASLLTREKCGKFSGAFGLLLIAVALLNCWWFLSLFVNNTQFDLIKLSGNRNSSHMEGPGDYTSSNHTIDQASASPDAGEQCDFSKGRWVADTRPPLYTNETCRYIHRSQDCMKNGRPDRGYLYWRWQPIACELPSFDAQLFLTFMRHKSMVFIGDSIARNHMQSLLCALSQVEDPQNVYFDVKEKEATWKFLSYNFTLANIWSPFLVNHTFEKNIYNIHLDTPDVMWTTSLADYEFAIISSGYWYFRPSIYYMNNEVLGMNPHSGVNLTTFDKLPAMKIAWETVLNYMLKEFKGVTIVRTITVPHFESGSWSNGGACNKTQPFFDPLMQEPLPWMSHAITKLQLEEFTRAMDHNRLNTNDTSKLKILNITYSSFLRPDGHPSHYRIQTRNEPTNDCLHWCLPGPIDTWNQILLHMLLH